MEYIEDEALPINVVRDACELEMLLPNDDEALPIVVFRADCELEILVAREDEALPIKVESEPVLVVIKPEIRA